jgi:hypothetical protein
VCGINDPAHTCDEYLILLAKSGIIAPPLAEAAPPVGSTSRTLEPKVVVVSTSGSVSGIVVPCCACEEDAPVAGSVITGMPPATATLVAESGLGDGSPLPWAASTTKSWGALPLIAPLPLEPWDAGVASGFVALQHASRDQKGRAKEREEKRKKLQ